MKNILYIFFRYYNDGPTKDIAYLKSVTVFLLLLFINILTVLGFLDIELPSMEEETTMTKYLFFLGFYGLPALFIINRMVKKKDLEDENLAIQYKNIYGWLLVGYWLLSILMLILSVKFKETDKIDMKIVNEMHQNI